ncbi:hypothetical protein [Spirilliplanes yamanashiensis]|nr:hypothetical protein [Spirilliplanes yamanashiensis]MDP9819062.1 hypothetical protein [Spirilliplanes yamanashiensis]
MTYRVEYGGGDVEIPALDAAIESAKQAIAADAGPVSEWVVEHDEAINDWFVQGLVNGRPVGTTAVVSGPEPTVPVDLTPTSPAAPEGWLQSVAFDGGTPAEVFGKATAWLAAAHPGAVEVSDVGWQAGPQGLQLRLHYRGSGGAGPW